MHGRLLKKRQAVFERNPTNECAALAVIDLDYGLAGFFTLDKFGSGVVHLDRSGRGWSVRRL